MENLKTQPSPTGWQLALDRAPQFLSVILLFSLPFLTQPKGFDPLFPKSTMTQALVYLMVGLWALRVHSSGRLVVVTSGAVWALAALTLWAGLSLLFTPYPGVVQMGLRDLSPFLLWYLLLTFTCTEAWRGENLLVVFLLSGGVVALWAIGQALGWAEGHWTGVSRDIFGGKPVAGLGKPLVLGGFLLLVWPVALGLLVRSVRPSARVLWGLVVLSSLTALFLTGSGPAWTGSLAGAAVFALALLRERTRRNLSWAVGLCLFLAISFLLPPSLERMKGINGTGDQPQVRREVLAGAWGIFRDHPLEGTGPGTFYAAFPSHQPYPFSMREGEILIRHAGNWVLEGAADMGLVGLALLLTFGGFILAQWWKLFTAHAVPVPLAAGFFAAVTGLGVDGLFTANDHTPVILVPLLFLAALPVALSQRFLRLPGFPLQEKVIDLSPYKLYLLPLLTLVVAVCLWQVKDAFARQGADVLLGKGYQLSREGKWTEALPLYNAAVKAHPADPRAYHLRAEAWVRQPAAIDAQRSLEDLEKVGWTVPNAHQLHWDKYRVLTYLDRRGEAVGELKAAVRSQPYRIRETEGFRRAGDLLARGKKVEALDLYMRLVADHPSCVPLMVPYAKALAAVGRTSDARMVLGDALKLHPGNGDAMKGLEALEGGAP